MESGELLPGLPVSNILGQHLVSDSAVFHEVLTSTFAPELCSVEQSTGGHILISQSLMPGRRELQSSLEKETDDFPSFES